MISAVGSLLTASAAGQLCHLFASGEKVGIGKMANSEGYYLIHIGTYQLWMTIQLIHSLHPIHTRKCWRTI
jgi:hypothetical protein